MNLYQQSGSNNLIGWNLDVVGHLNLFSRTRVKFPVIVSIDCSKAVFLLQCIFVCLFVIATVPLYLAIVFSRISSFYGSGSLTWWPILGYYIYIYEQNSTSLEDTFTDNKGWSYGYVDAVLFLFCYERPLYGRDLFSLLNDGTYGTHTIWLNMY